MVTQTLKSLSNAEKKLEHGVDASIENNGQQDPAEQSAREMRRMAETVTFSAVSAAEQWGKKALDKTKDITEDICL